MFLSSPRMAPAQPPSCTGDPMNPLACTASAADRRTLRASLTAVGGPPLVGFIGGALGTALIALALGHLDQLVRNAAGAYEAFPDGDGTRLARDWGLPPVS